MSNPVLDMTRDTDMYDPFGWVQGWRFALCDYLTFDLGESVPFFRASAFGPEEDSYEYQELISLNPEAEEAQYALKILDRYREWVRIAGRDY